MNESQTPKKEKQVPQNQSIPTNYQLSPVKVPNGSKQIGNYILGKTIGSGTYGKVHLGLHMPTGEKVAAKVIEKGKLHAKDLERIHREIQILKKIMHPSLIQLYETIETERSLLLITEYMQNGELFNYILDRKKLPEEEACRIFHQVIDGVQYMHQIGVVHRDLKPENILIDYNFKVKIIDFGLSNIYKQHQKLKTQCGSPCYAAPEMIEGKDRYEPILVDIWSVGIVLFAMLTGYLPFCDPDISKLYKKIMAGNFKCPQWLSDEAQDLIEKILVVNPSKRARIQQIKQHPWMRIHEHQKLIGIDSRHFKIPIEYSIINNIENMGVKIPNLAQLLQLNTKNKETALYYIIAKKMVKQKQSVKSFYGSPQFKHQMLVSLKTRISENGEHGQSTQIQGEAVTPIELDANVIQTPQTNSGFELISIKSKKFKNILSDFMNAETPHATKETEIMKEEFYAHNLLNHKKTQNLKISSEILTKEEKAMLILKTYLKGSAKKDALKATFLPEIINPKSKLETLNTASTCAPRRKRIESQYFSVRKNI